MTRLFKEPRALVRQGPLGPSIDVFAERLKEQGYGKHTIGSLTRLVADFCCWINLRRIDVPALAQEQVERYVKYRKRHRYARPEDQTTLMRFLGLLVQQGLVEEIAAPTEIPAVQVLQEDYRRYLQQERRLAAATIVHYIDVAGRFLRRLYGSGEVRLGSLCPADIIDFVQGEAARVRAGRARFVTTALRSFLRYARYRDLIKTDLRGCVPTVANWSMASIPKAISHGEVQSLLAHCNRRTAVGCRDYAILLLLARLGLRGGEISGLTLDDLNWEAGELRIRGPGEREDYLPIPPDVGAALADYLRRRRPRCSTRHVFVRARAPRLEFVSAAAITHVVQRALKRAHLNPSLKGSHLLRHSLATHMLRRGASLAEIGEVLRHRNQQTTTIYAKVDLDSLRPLALRWPGGVR
jgi:integrase/recombinase XerD